MVDSTAQRLGRAFGDSGGSLKVGRPIASVVRCIRTRDVMKAVAAYTRLTRSTSTMWPFLPLQRAGLQQGKKAFAYCAHPANRMRWVVTVLRRPTSGQNVVSG